MSKKNIGFDLENKLFKFQSKFLRFNKENSQYSISIPTKAIKQFNLNKESKFKIVVKVVEEE